jgi:hypothetical protein
VFAKIPEVIQILSKWPTIPQSLAELKQALQIHNAKSSLLSLLDIAVRLEEELSDKEEMELIFMSKELSEKALMLYKSYLAHSVKEVNKKVIKNLAK